MNWPIWVIIGFAVAGILVGWLQAKVKGIIGEKKVSVVLATLPNSDYIILNDVMLPTEKGSTQIDHIVVSLYGIFVIETKNYKGWITGSSYAEQWTKNMYGKKYKFYNPIRQNYGHIKNLSTILGLSEEKFISIVAFSANSTIKVKSRDYVVHILQVKKVIKSYKEPVFTQDEIKQLADRIKTINEASSDLRVGHVKRIKEAQNIRKNNKEVQRICPKCGGKIVYKRGKYGKFLGCANYPNCRYTKEMK